MKLKYLYNLYINSETQSISFYFESLYFSYICYKSFNSYSLSSATSSLLLTVFSMTAPVYDLDQEEPRFQLAYIVAPHIAS